MAASTAVVVLKTLHVLVASTWVGGTAVMNLVVFPQLRKASPAARGEVLGRLGKAGVRFGNVVGGLTILTGAALAYAMTGSFRLEGAWGRLVAVALLLALAVLYLLDFAIRPSLKMIEVLAKDVRPNEPLPLRLVFLQKRVAVTGAMGLTLLVLALVVMVAANLTAAP